MIVVLSANINANARHKRQWWQESTKGVTIDCWHIRQNKGFSETSSIVHIIQRLFLAGRIIRGRRVVRKAGDLLENKRHA